MGFLLGISWHSCSLWFDCFCCLHWEDSACSLKTETAEVPWHTLHANLPRFPLFHWWVSEITESWGASVALVGHGSIVLKKNKTTTQDWISSYFFSSSSDQKCDCTLFRWPLSKPTPVMPFLFLNLNSEHHWFFEQLFFVSLDVVIDYGAWKFSYLPCSACWNARLPKELKQWNKGLPHQWTAKYWFESWAELNFLLRKTS